jgi:hypothetical protein
MFFIHHASLGIYDQAQKGRRSPFLLLESYQQIHKEEKNNKEETNKQ